MSKGKKDMLMLAMDLSLNGSAFAVLEVFKHSVSIVEVVQVDNTSLPADKLPEKLANIYFNLDDLLSRYEFTHIVKEKGFTRFHDATRKLAKVEGVVDFTLYCNGYPNSIIEITPMEVKKCLTGNGKAGKDDVARGIPKYLTRSQREAGVDFETTDISDAVAIGITYAVKNKLITEL